MSHRLPLRFLPARLAVARLAPTDAFPPWATGPIVSLTRTPTECSVVCDEAAVPASIKSERGWRALVVEGTLDFSSVGILASLAVPLAAAGVSLFGISTYDTDYILMRERDVEAATRALVAAGHVVQG